MIDDPSAVFTNLTNGGPSARNIVVGEGSFVVERMLVAAKSGLPHSGLRMISVLCTDAQLSRYSNLASGICPVFAKPEKEISEIVGFKFHRGVIGAAYRPLLPPLAQFVSRLPQSRTVAVCINVADTENIGSIVRSSKAFGFDYLIIGPGCGDPFSRKAIRASMAACFSVSLLSIGSPSDLSALKQAGFVLVGTSPDSRVGIPLRGLRDEMLRQSGKPVSGIVAAGINETTIFSSCECIAVLFGNEAFGLDESWSSACDVFASVPMSPGIDSLNVGVAAGIILYELSKL
jgi:tRNA G18 (ribose-2'-O)-methylase SpoU